MFHGESLVVLDPINSANEGNRLLASRNDFDRQHQIGVSHGVERFERGGFDVNQMSS